MMASTLVQVIDNSAAMNKNDVIGGRWSGRHFKDVDIQSYATCTQDNL